LIPADAAAHAAKSAGIGPAADRTALEPIRFARSELVM
jgi:hypothetical protein